MLLGRGLGDGAGAQGRPRETLKCLLGVRDGRGGFTDDMKFFLNEGRVVLRWLLKGVLGFGSCGAGRKDQRSEPLDEELSWWSIFYMYTFPRWFTYRPLTAPLPAALVSAMALMSSAGGFESCRTPYIRVA